MATIMLVDDDDFVRRMVRTALERAGYAVVEAATPGEALELCRAYVGPIDLVLTDVLMPQMRGTDLVPLLLARRPELRALYMSGFTGDGRRPEPLLEKPFTIASLQHAIADVLAEPRAA
jgi:CheY-like chemotaxis protein